MNVMNGKAYRTGRAAFSHVIMKIKDFLQVCPSSYKGIYFARLWELNHIQIWRGAARQNSTFRYSVRLCAFSDAGTPFRIPTSSVIKARVQQRSVVVA